MALHGLGSAYDTTTRKPLNSIENITSRTLRGVRLEQARRMILADEAGASVTQIAMACQFASFGHFARRYREKFGELPSETMAKRLKASNG